MKIITNGCAKSAQIIQDLLPVTYYEYLIDPIQRFNSTYRKLLTNITEIFLCEIQGSVLSFDQFFHDIVKNLPTILDQQLTDDTIDLYIRAIVGDYVVNNAFHNFMDLETSNNTNEKILKHYRMVAKQMMLDDIHVFIHEYCKMHNWLYNMTVSVYLCITEIEKYLHYNSISHNIVHIFHQEYTNMLNLLSTISKCCNMMLSRVG
jgi:hypothetical protein